MVLDFGMAFSSPGTGVLVEAGSVQSGSGQEVNRPNELF
jgi:hypothetical protein